MKKTFNASFYLALYAAVNGWVYLATTGRASFAAPKESIFISVIVTLPLLLMAIKSLRSGSNVGTGEREEKTAATPAIIEENLPPHIVALFAAGALIFFVYWKTGHHVFFFEPRIEGWSWLEGIVLLIICSAIGASGLAINSGYAAISRAGESAPGKKPSGFLLLSISANARLIVYFLLFVTIMLAATIALYAWHPSRTLYGLIVMTGRASLPLTLILLAAFIRLPIVPFILIADAGILFLAGYNTTRKEAAVFAAVQIITGVAWLLILKIISRISAESKIPTQVIASEPASTTPETHE